MVAINNRALMPGVTVGERGADGKINWMSPNNGKYLVHHVDTFMNRYTSLASVYRDYDEALLDSRDNARFMRNDVGIRECLDARQRSVALLDWHIEPESKQKATKSQEEFCGILESVLRRISHFYEYRRNCQHAIWYGKYGIQHRWGVQEIEGKSIYMPTPRHQDDWGWQPLSGDKLVFRQLRPDRRMEPGAYEGQLGIRVGNNYKAGDVLNGRWKVEPTDYGLGYFLSPAERRLMLVHKHHIEDAAYEDGLRSGSIYGVGVRSVIYWEWVQKQDTMAFLVNYLTRMAGGIQIWKYPQGNPQAEAEVKAAAENYDSSQQQVLLVPIPVGDMGQYGVEVIEPGFAGIDAIQNLIHKHYEHRVKRYILGQVMSSEAEAAGLGSGLAELQQDTLLQIIRSDATNLEETLSTDLVQAIIKTNVAKKAWPDPGFRPKFVIETENPDVDAILQNVCQLVDRGLPIRKSDLYELIGMAQPMAGDDVLQCDPNQGGGDGAGGEGLPNDAGGEESQGLSESDPERPPERPEVRSESDKNPKPAEEDVSRYSRPKSPWMKSAIPGIRTVRVKSGKGN